MTMPSPHGEAGPGPLPHERWARRLAIGLVLLAIPLQYVYLTRGALASAKACDFISYYTAGRVAAAGLDPYNSGPLDVEHPAFRRFIRDYSAWATPDDPAPREFRKWYGALGYPPSIYPIFVGISRLEWFPALAAWSALITLMALTCGTLSWTFDSTDRHRDPLTQVVVGLLFVFHPITSNHIGCGQAAMFMCAGVALGQWARRHDRDWLASFLWSFCLIKPQIGFQLAAVAVVVGGWRFAAKVALWGAVMNVVGGLVATGDPLMLTRMLGAARVTYSPAAVFVDGPLAPKVVSWNRILYLATGKVIMLNPARMLLGQLAWLVTVVGLARLRGPGRWSIPYALAAAACGAVLMSPSHNYDLVMLVLVVPYGFALWDEGNKLDVALLLALLLLMTPPASLAERIIAQLHVGPGLAGLLISYRSFVLLVACLYLLIRGRPLPLTDDDRPGIARA